MQLVTAAELGATWRPGCPVAPEQMRRVELDYVGFDGRTHRGALVVYEQLVADVIAIFGGGDWHNPIDYQHFECR